MSTPYTEKTTIRLPKRTKQRLQRAAKNSKYPIQVIVNRALEHYFIMENVK